MTQNADSSLAHGVAEARSAHEPGCVAPPRGRPRTAPARVRRGAGCRPGNATALNNLGFVTAQEGDLAGAVELYEAAIRSNPAHATAYANLGNALAGAGRPVRRPDCAAVVARARACRTSLALDSLAKVSPARRRARPGRAGLARGRSASRPATSSCSPRWGRSSAPRTGPRRRSRSCARPSPGAPDDARAWSQLGSVLFVRDDLGSAAEALRRALALAPEDRAAAPPAVAGAPRPRRPRRGRARARAPAGARPRRPCAPESTSPCIDLADGDRRAAAARLDQVLAVAPDEPRARFYRAVVADLLGEDSAEAVLRELAAGDGPFADRARQPLADRSRPSAGRGGGRTPMAEFPRSPRLAQGRPRAVRHGRQHTSKATVVVFQYNPESGPADAGEPDRPQSARRRRQPRRPRGRAAGRGPAGRAHQPVDRPQRRRPARDAGPQHRHSRTGHLPGARGSRADDVPAQPRRRGAGAPGPSGRSPGPSPRTCR